MDRSQKIINRLYRKRQSPPVFAYVQFCMYGITVVIDLITFAQSAGAVEYTDCTSAEG